MGRFPLWDAKPPVQQGDVNHQCDVHPSGPPMYGCKMIRCFNDGFYQDLLLNEVNIPQ